MFAFDVTNPEHRFILETARRWGVSPSTFMGDSKMISQLSVTGIHEGYSLIPGWTNEERTAALALAQYENELCEGCGHPLAETSLPEREFDYLTDPPIRCHRCTAIEMAQEAVQSKPQPGALHLSVRLRGPEDAPGRGVPELVERDV